MAKERVERENQEHSMPRRSIYANYSRRKTGLQQRPKAYTRR
jgi:hypothetical protein